MQYNARMVRKESDKAMTKHMNGDRTSLGTTRITWFISASVCFTYNFQHRLIQFPINFYSSLIHYNHLSIILTAMSSEDIAMQPIPSGPSMLNLSSRFSIDTADIMEAHRLHNIVHSLPPPTPLFLPLHDHPPPYYNQAPILY